MAASLLQDEIDTPGNLVLFNPITLSRAVAAPDVPHAIRSRLVDVNWNVLGGANGPPHDGTGKGKRLQLNLFSDREFVAVYDRVEQNLSGSFTWVGHLQGIEYSTVLFVVQEQQMVGLVAAPGESFEIRPVAGGAHVVLQVDESAFVLEPDDAIVPKALDASSYKQPASIGGYADGGSIIDVMVIYSAEAIAENPAIESDIELAVAYTNQAYVNSQINQRLALVHTAQVAYDGPRDSLDSALVALRNVDGYIDEIHTWRDTYHADLVSFVVGEIPGEYAAGLGYLLTNPYPYNESWGFSALQSISMAGHVFAHELGHNMGGHHDWYIIGPTPTIYPYAHGYVDPDVGFRTIMAYHNLCIELGRWCPTLPYFSNPDLSYRGAPLGVPEGTSTSCSAGSIAHYRCDADNRKTLNNTAALVAGYRSSEKVWSGAV
ncbi:MAG: hypothetical protein GY832_05030, partial [Chloroflexi bacterium]|nr:hypothetical protein [Chloroflexota bacterium]